MGNLLKQLKEARNFPINTCPASRHVEMIAEQLFKGKVCKVLNEDPKHSAESMLSTIKSLYLERIKNIELKKQLSEAQSYKADAERYRWLRNRDLDQINLGGVFAGMTPENIVLNELDLDEAIDQAMKESND